MDLNELLVRLNKRRHTQLSRHPGLDNVIQEHCEFMNSSKRLTHDKLKERINTFSYFSGISTSKYGEVVARGQQSPEAVVSAWLWSRGHRRIIRDNDYTLCGLGYSNGYWGAILVRPKNNMELVDLISEKIVESIGPEVRDRLVNGSWDGTITHIPKAAAYGNLF